MQSLFQAVVRSATGPQPAHPFRAFKVVSALRRRCADCRIVRRGKKIYVLCNENPRHKQRQGKGGAAYRTTK